MALRDNVGSNVLVAAAIVCGALILSWRSPTSEPRYQLAASGSTIVRLDTESGALIACDQQICHQIQAPAPAQTGNPITNVFNNVRSKVEQKEIEDRAKK
jgi:cytochrome c2